MKVVMIGPVYPYRGGIAHYTTQLALAFSKRNADFRLISFRRQYPSWLYPGKSDRDPSGNPAKVNAEYLLDPLYPWTWVQTAHRIAGFHPDMVIFQWWSTFWAPAYMAMAFLLRRQKIPIIFNIHNVLPHETHFWDRPLARACLGLGQKSLVHTQREKDRLLSLLPHAQVTVAPFPIYGMFTDQHISMEQARKALGMPADASIALFFGLVRPYKGLKFALEALAQLNKRNQPVHLIVAGEFWEDRETYRRLIEELDLAGLVKIEDRYIPDEQIGLYFSVPNLFVAPYIDGTQSAAVKIALSFNLPVIISRAIASEELESDTHHRLYWVSPADASALADAISQCLQENACASHPLNSSGRVDEWDRLAETLEGMV